VIFEVRPRPGNAEAFLRLAKALRPELERIDGFLAIERFAGRDYRSRVLSLSIWRDEKALIRWRTQAAHHAAREAGRASIFADHHLRVGEIVAGSDGEPPPQQRGWLPPNGLKASTTRESACCSSVGATRRWRSGACWNPPVAHAVIDGSGSSAITACSIAPRRRNYYPPTAAGSR
jgi:heme-degrading monooxygenase HmoA